MTDGDHNSVARAEHIYQPKIRHEKRNERPKVMVTNQPTHPEIRDFGSLKRIVGPPAWLKVEEESGGIGARQSHIFRTPEASDVCINAFYRGRPVDKETAVYFAKLLSSKVPEGTTSALRPEHIRALHAVLGLNTVGDNQFTNNAPKGTRNYPVFHVTSAELTRLNGRTVLRVLGNFQNEEGLAGNEYAGILYPSKTHPDEIEELFFQAPTRAKYLRYLNAFEQTLKTVEWK